MSRRTVYRAIYVPCLLALGGLVVTFAHPTHSRATPAGMKTFEAKDNSFRVSYPAEWRKLVSNQNGTGTQARFQRDAHAEVVVTCDLVGSIMLDFSRNGNPSGVALPGMEGVSGGAGAAQKTPLQAAHEAGATHLVGELPRYAEQPPTASKIGGNDALTSAFTAQTADMFNAREVVGKRITILAGNRPVTVDAYCPKNDDNEFFSTVDAMLKTLSISEVGG